MKILAISDTHGKHRELKDLPKADMVIFAGDICKVPSLYVTLDFIDWFFCLPYKYKIFQHLQ